MEEVKFGAKLSSDDRANACQKVAVGDVESVCFVKHLLERFGGRCFWMSVSQAAAPQLGWSCSVGPASLGSEVGAAAVVCFSLGKNFEP